MKVLSYNFSALNDLQGNEGIDIRERKSLNRLSGVYPRRNTSVSATESYSGIPEKDSVFL